VEGQSLPRKDKQDATEDKGHRRDAVNKKKLTRNFTISKLCLGAPDPCWRNGRCRKQLRHKQILYFCFLTQNHEQRGVLARWKTR
jgi:hypothetical protein